MANELKILLAAVTTVGGSLLSGAVMADDNSDNAQINADRNKTKVSDYTQAIEHPRLVKGPKSVFQYDGDAQLGARICNSLRPIARTAFTDNGITYTRWTAINAEFMTDNIKVVPFVTNDQTAQAEILENSKANGAVYEYKTSIDISRAWYTGTKSIQASTDVLILKEDIDCSQPSSSGTTTVPGGGSNPNVGGCGPTGCGTSGGSDSGNVPGQPTNEGGDPLPISYVIPYGAPDLDMTQPLYFVNTTKGNTGPTKIEPFVMQVKAPAPIMA